MHRPFRRRVSDYMKRAKHSSAKSLYRKIPQAVGDPCEPAESRIAATLKPGVLGAMLQTQCPAHSFLGHAPGYSAAAQEDGQGRFGRNGNLHTFLRGG